MFSPHDELDADADSDVSSDEDDSDEARKEIEIALYSQINYKADECAGGSKEQNFADLSYEFQVYRASSNDDTQKKVDEGVGSILQTENVTVSKDRSDRQVRNEPIDCDKLHFGEEVQNHNSSLNFLPLDESIDCKLGVPQDDVMIVSDDECSVNDCIEVSSDSVMEEEPDEYLSSCEDDVDFDSDCMLLDESMSENEEIQVNVDDNQKKLLKKRSKADVERWQILDVDRFGEPPAHTTNRYYGNRFMRCYNCRDLGHSADDCPKPQKMEICIFCGVIGHHYRNCPVSICYNCKSPGHIAKDCTGRRTSIHYVCFRCNMKGHDKKVCPDLWRQYHLTVDKDTPLRGDNEENPRVFCCNCGIDGHFGYECEEDRMDRHSTATYPLVARYDHTKGFKRVSKKRKKGNIDKGGTKRRKTGAPDYDWNTTDIDKSVTVKERKLTKLKGYCDGMNRIVNSLENSQDLEPVKQEPKKRRKLRRNKQKQNKISNATHQSEGKVQETGGKKKKKKKSKFKANKNNDNVKTAVNNKNVSKNFKKPMDYFPRSKVSTGVGNNSREVHVHHHAFNNEWWLKKVKGKGGQKKGNKEKGGQNNTNIPNFNRGFRTKSNAIR